MYNRYINQNGNNLSANCAQTAADDIGPIERREPSEPDIQRPQSKLSGALKNIFGGSFRLPELNSDTLLLLILVYFLVADDENGNINDTILIIAAIFLLGL